MRRYRIFLAAAIAVLATHAQAGLVDCDAHKAVLDQAQRLRAGGHADQAVMLIRLKANDPNDLRAQYALGLALLESGRARNGKTANRRLPGGFHAARRHRGQSRQRRGALDARAAAMPEEQQRIHDRQPHRRGASEQRANGAGATISSESARTRQQGTAHPPTRTRSFSTIWERRISAWAISRTRGSISRSPGMRTLPTARGG